MVLANGGVKSAYEWFNGFMGLVLGILIGSFILGAFTKVANTSVPPWLSSLLPL